MFSTLISSSSVPPVGSLGADTGAGPHSQPGPPYARTRALETIELSFVEIIKSSKNVHLFYGRRVGGLATALHLLYDSPRSRQEKECIPHPAVYFSYFNFDFCVVGASESDGVESIFLRP